MKTLRLIAAIACGFAVALSNAQAEQYATGSHAFISEQGSLKVNVGRVNLAGAGDALMYSFLFKPKNSNEFFQVARADSAADSKAAFFIQTKHSAAGVLFDAKVTIVNNQLNLIVASSASAKSTKDDGAVELTTYEISRLDNPERWVFLKKSSRKLESKTSVEKALDEIPKILDK